MRTVTAVVVEEGDTLSAIALKYLDGAEKWPKLYELNKSRIPDPGKLYVGDVVVIPNECTCATIYLRDGVVLSETETARFCRPSTRR